MGLLAPPWPSGVAGTGGGDGVRVGGVPGGGRTQSEVQPKMVQESF